MCPVVILSRWQRHLMFQVLGKWIVAAESTSFQKAEDLKKEFLENYWLKVTAIDNSDAVAVITSVKA